MALTLMSKQTSLSATLQNNFFHFTESLLNSSGGSALHLIFLTDAAAKPFIQKTLSDGIGRILSRYVIMKETRNTLNKNGWKFPRIRAEYVDLQSFVAGSKDLIDELKDVYCSGSQTVLELEDDDYYFEFVTFCYEKYRLDFFYLVPLYHLYFPKSLDKLIILDVDLVFRIDLSELKSHFDVMDNRQIFGAAKDFGFLYGLLLQKYRVQNNLSFGASGMNYALNSGVLLVDLKKLRDSLEADKLFSVQYSKELVDKYQLNGITGDQDMLNLLRWELPHLFYSLHCSYNNQRDAYIGVPKPTEPEALDLYGLANPPGEDLRDCDGGKIIHRLGSNINL